MIFRAKSLKEKNIFMPFFPLPKRESLCFHKGYIEIFNKSFYFRETSNFE